MLFREMGVWGESLGAVGCVDARGREWKREIAGLRYYRKVVVEDFFALAVEW